MIVAISYYEGDRDLMKRWASHVERLGPYPTHKLILCPTHGQSTDGILEHLRGFGQVIVEPNYIPQKGWPVSCNNSFETIGRYVETNLRTPFLFMEPDAVPLCSGWIDKIQEEYVRARKHFMGDFVSVKHIKWHEDVIDHMSGVAVYPGSISQFAPTAFRNEHMPWDLASANQVVPQMHRTQLIHHDFATTGKWRRDVVDASCVREGAVIYHPDKKGVLFNDGLAIQDPIPNDLQGDPAMGDELVTHIPHETKEQEPVKSDVDLLIESIIYQAKQDVKAKKKILQALIQEGIIKPPKTQKRAKRVGGKVRKDLATA